LTINGTKEDTTSQSNDETLEITNNELLLISKTESNYGFDLGLVIGIAVGIAIGISVLFIIRQKSD